jgi:hypothetical protein
MDENSPQGRALVFNDPYIAEIRDDDLVSVLQLFVINCSQQTQNDPCFTAITAEALSVDSLLRVKELIKEFLEDF